MKLTSARIQNFRSIEDTGRFDIDDLTCLVGKNEAGKTAILEALYGVNPYRPFSYDKIRDYPRRFLSKFDERHPRGNCEVVCTWWKLSDYEVSSIEKDLGEGILISDEVQVQRYIGYEKRWWVIKINEEKYVTQKVDALRLNAAENSQVSGLKTASAIVEKIKTITDPAPKLVELRDALLKLGQGSLTTHISEFLEKRLPKFFLTSHFDRMSGELSLQKLEDDKRNKTLSAGDQIFLDFIEYAGTSLEELQSTKKYEELVGRCEAASNDITDEMLEFWSQNDALSIKIDIGQGKAEDPAPFNSGAIVKIRIYNQNHRASVPLSERSAGFVWFFSFLSQFKQLSGKAGNVVILLDEPGLTLHGKAQADLLRYIKERLLEEHQVIFTTHSPFMVPSNELSKVRVVEDLVRYKERGKAEILGTKVTSEVLSVDADTLFPLRSHLGYEITQSLFIGENTLLVEGPSDVLYLQAASYALKKRKRTPLSEKWTVCPTGGIDKIHPFAALFVGNRLNIAVLCDYGDGDKKKVEKLRQSEILKSSQIFTTSDFTGKTESDVEDFFEPELYCKLVNISFEVPKSKSLTPKTIEEATGTPRYVKKAEAALNLIPEVPEFDHFTPAAFLIRNLQLLDDDTDSVKKSLDRFEEVFKKLNLLLSP